MPIKTCAFRIMVLTGLIAGVVGCQTVETGPDVDEVVQSPPDRFEQFRVEVGQASSSEVDVLPLDDPPVRLLLDRAAQAMIAGDQQTAVDLLQRAQTLDPTSPTVLQSLAEARLSLGDEFGAREMSLKAANVGSPVGMLCHRQWTLIAIVDEAAGVDDHAEESRRRARACLIERRKTL